MNIGYLLHLQRAFQRYRIVCIASNKKHGVIAVILCRKLRYGCAHIQGLLNLLRQLPKMVNKHLIVFVGEIAHGFCGAYAKQIEHGKLRCIAFGGGNRNFGPCPSIERMVCELCNGTAYNIYYGKRLCAAPFALFHGGDCVRGFTGLG